MISRLLALTIMVTLLCTSAPIYVYAQDDGPQPPHDEIKMREQLAQSGRYLFQPSTQGQASSFETTSGSSLAEAMDIPASVIVNATLSGPGEGSAAFFSLGVLKPLKGESFALLSSGIAGSSLPEPGTDFAPQGTSEGDQVKLILQLNIPPGVNFMSFVFNFLSAEYPDFIGVQFNDTFTALLKDDAGVREMTRASVNSSIFVPAADTNAGGSGFDLFTEDPSGVDLEFGSGLPDAGLTGYELVNVPVIGGRPATLEFTIEDQGDGIFDSAVIIDNFVFSSLEVIDPNPVFLTNGHIINDPETLARGGSLRVGVAADGVTQVLLRNKIAGPGTVEFCLQNGFAPEDGGLLLLGTIEPKTCITAPVIATSQGYLAYAVYQSPNEFYRRLEDMNLGSRTITFRVRFMAIDGTTSENSVPFLIVRPPVVLVHGLWSNENAWTLPLVFDSRFKVFLADYQSTNASRYSTNQFVPFKNEGEGIYDALKKMRTNKIAATQVDIAGHSMGGILSRNYVEVNEFKRNTNFNAGDYHKLITLNTPHSGSPLANLLVLVRDGLNPIDRFLWQTALRKLGYTIDAGAVDDLAVGSDAIDAMLQTAVPAHAVVGIGGSTTLENAPEPIGSLYRVINFFADYSDLFQGLQHDYIVGRNSQEGGMTSAHYTVFDGLDSIHTSVTGSSNYSQRLIELLNSPATGSLFAQFPKPAIKAATSVPQVKILSGGDIPSQSIEDGLQITSPQPGTVVSPGEQISVIVEVVSDASVSSVLLVGPGISQVDDSSPFEFSITIPLEAAGNFGLSATGKDSGGAFYGSNDVTLQAIPNAALESITLMPKDPILSAIGETRNLIVLGNYSDGVTRDIASSAVGTEYLVSDPEIIAISPDGTVTALRQGASTVVARNGATQTSVSIRVLLENQIPTADAGPEQSAIVGNLVTLDGSASNDPDNGPEPLSYEWFQIAGSQVSLNNNTIASPSFIPPTAGRYIFSLIVRDGQSDSAADRVVVDVEATDLRIRKSIATTTVSPGSVLTYTISYVNDGLNAAANVVIVDSLPTEISDVRFVSSDTITQFGDEDYSWSVGEMSPGAQGIITVTGVVAQGLSAGYAFTNTVIITTTAFDTDISNNSDAIEATVANIAPQATDSHLSTNEDIAVSGKLIGTDANGDNVTFEISVEPGNGTISLNESTGEFEYTPSANFNGVNSFTFAVRDTGGLSDTATVTLNVAAVNDPPTAANDTFTVSMNSSNNALDILANDSSSPDNNETLVITTVGLPTNGGTVTVNNSQTRIIYTPAANFSGTDTCTYIISDGNGGSSSATVEIKVVTTVGSVSGVIFVDANSNGIQESLEVGIEGAKIILTSVDGQTTKETTSGDNGEYSVMDLPVGIYTIDIDLPTGYMFTADVPSQIEVSVGGVSGLSFGAINGVFLPLIAN